ncbi:MAG TPA: OsmC family protein [Gemmatimonadota bacterium]
MRVRSVSHRRSVQELGARGHRWLADRPRGQGGDGLGPTPLELLLGSFAAQTAMGILDLAREKEWAVDAVEVDVAQADPADGLRDLERVLVIRGELDEAERAELEAEVAARWPRAAWLAPGQLRDRFSYS